MDKQLLKEVLLDQQTPVMPETFVSREVFSEIENLEQSKQVVVISGLRRCGKSTFLQEIRRRSTESHYFINFDDDRLVSFELQDFQMLFELFIELYGEEKTFYFDEIQNIPEWERFVRRLHEQGYKIYLTGSNATLFSQELGTRLTGRYLKIEMYPFSFREYLSTKEPSLLSSQHTTIEKGLIKHFFNDYATKGGIPANLLHVETQYLQTLYESILYRDIIVRHRITQARVIKELVYYLAGNVAKEMSYNALRKLLGVPSPSTISDYCGYLQDSYLCFFIGRFDFSLKKQMQYNKKNYFIDSAMAKTVGFRMSEDQGRLLENIVFVELKRRGHEIYFHRQTKECDFVLRQGPHIVAAIQVCAQLTNPLTKKRELEGLLEAMSHYQLKEGLILTEDESGEEELQEGGQDYKVRILPVWQWLLT